MIRRFIIGVDALTPQEEKSLRKYLSEKGTWWHWISNLWLFVTTDSEVTAQSINAELKTINGDARTLVMEIQEDINWSARAKPNSKGGTIGDWLKKQWVEGE